MSFSEHALDYHAIGITPLPVLDKRPCVAGFNDWTGLGVAAVESLSAEHPDADLAILTRLSGLLVVDVDSTAANLYVWVIDEFGWTPLVAKTKRGYHLYYSNPKGIKGVIGDGTYPIDIKGAGNSDYVVAPPSKGYEFVEIYLDEEPHNFGNRDIYDFLELIPKRLPEPNPAAFAVFFPNHLTKGGKGATCLLYTSPSPRDQRGSRMPSSA